MNIKTYICHHAPLASRKEKLLAQVNKIGLDVEWVEHFQNVNDNIEEILLSVWAKYAYCFIDSLVYNRHYILILEDDVDLPDDFKQVLQGCLMEFICRNGDVLSLGVANNQHFIETTGNIIHYAPDLKTRCCHAMVYTLDCIKRIMYDCKFSDNLQPNIDHKLNDVIKRLSLKHFWYEPGIPQLDYDAYSNLKRFR